MKEPVIKTFFSPVPGQWCAWRDGDEESGVRGWGKTKEDAIDDLLAQEEDE